MMRRDSSHAAMLAGVLVLLGATASADEPVLDAHASYTAERSRPMLYDLELLVTVTAPYKTKRLRVWMPIPTSDHGQEVLASEVTTFPDGQSPRIGSEPLFGNRFAYFEFADPLGAQVLRHKLRIRVWELRWQLEPERVQTISKWPASFAPYRRSESQAVVADERFEKLLAEILPRRQDPLGDFYSVLNWVDGNFAYDHVQASLQASSVHAIDKRRGHCSDYHGFCAAMGRLLGQPTRVTYGLNTFPKGSPSHCKLEAFLAPYGWVSFDVSETQKLTQSIQQNPALSAMEKAALSAAARNRLLRGFRDNTWFVQTRGTDYELAPPAASRVPVVRTIYAEADGRALPDPDPANQEQTTFAWMTAVKITANAVVEYPFSNLNTLNEWRR